MLDVDLEPDTDEDDSGGYVKENQRKEATHVPSQVWAENTPQYIRDAAMTQEAQELAQKSLAAM